MPDFSDYLQILLSLILSQHIATVITTRPKGVKLAKL